MSEPTVNTVLIRIRSLLVSEAEILEAIKDPVADVLSIIEDLASYLECIGDNMDASKLQLRINNESEDEIDKSTWKDESGGIGHFNFLRRFLIETTYETEDIIDGIIYKITYERIRRCRILTSYICKPCFQIEAQDIRKIEDIRRRLDKAKADIKELHLQRSAKTREAQHLRYWDKRQGLPPTSKEPHKLIGFEKDVGSLVDKLTRKGNHARVVYMVGGEGAGKTTLATELYNNSTIKQHFESIVWTDASQQKDAKGIFLEILKQTQGKEEVDSKSTEELMHKVSNIIERRSCLIFLDDVEDPDDFASYVFLMIQGLKNKSKIVITTRTIPSHPYKNEEHVVSSDEDVDSLAEKVTMKNTTETSIFHMPGKQTTVLLLDDLYKNERVKQHFDSRIWVYIEDNWSTQSILVKILEEITRDKSLAKLPIHTQMEKLEELLSKKLYLIVLDQLGEAKGLVDLLHPVLKTTGHRTKVIFITNNPPSSLQNNEERVTGAELLDVGRLARKITGEGDQPNLFSIMDLVGSGHKTDLAKKLYDHPIVVDHFDDKVWITISKEWDTKAALYQIMMQITKKEPQKNSDKDPGTNESDAEDHGSKKKEEKAPSIKELVSALEKKKYLLVLDNIGDAGDLVFELLAEQSNSRSLKKESALKSKIIITVDNPRTYRHSNFRCFLYTMRSLTEDESWDLLCNIAENHAANSSAVKQIVSQFAQQPPEDILKKGEMLERSEGIPLAIVAIGGLLSTKEKSGEWKFISTSLRSAETPLHGGLRDILLLCYNDLPTPLMSCFLYFSLFPKNHEIPTGMLIRMWISEGLVTQDPQCSEQKTLEDVAVHYLEELARRCLIQVVRRNHKGEMKHIRLQDQIHKLSIEMSTELGFLQIHPHKEIEENLLRKPAIHSRKDFLQTRSTLLRRAAIHHGKFEKYPTQSSNLRSFVLFGKHGVSVKHYYFQHDALSLSLEPINDQFKLLRVLIVSGIRTRKALPAGIGDLIFLTYLGLRATNIQVLPESIGNLRKLMTLDYRGTLEPTIHEPLPNVLLQMTELRHVYLPHCGISFMKKLDFSPLHNLQTLWGVKGGDWIAKGFANISENLVKLGIVNISCKKELEVISKWLGRSKQLRVLKLDWHGAEQGRLQFPGNLHNLHCLHKLALTGRLREQYDFQLLPDLVKLELFFSNLAKDVMTNLGHLPHLKILRLWNSYKGIHWTCAKEHFLELEELQISHLPNLEEWIVEVKAMPKLKRLSIFNCRKLKRLPEGIKTLSLQQLEILDMPSSFYNRLQARADGHTAGGEDVHIIQDIPYVKFEAS